MIAADYLAAVAALMADPQTSGWAWCVLYSGTDSVNDRGVMPYAIEGRVLGGGGATTVRITPSRWPDQTTWTTAAGPSDNRPRGDAVTVGVAAIALARAALPRRLSDAATVLARAQAAYDALLADASMVAA